MSSSSVRSFKSRSESSSSLILASYSRKVRPNLQSTMDELLKLNIPDRLPELLKEVVKVLSLLAAVRADTVEDLSPSPPKAPALPKEKRSLFLPKHAILGFTAGLTWSRCYSGSSDRFSQCD